MRITQVRHPEYRDDTADYFKWRLCYKGGRTFIDHYLERFSRREDPDTFKSRRKISYNPAFAKVAINKLKNTLYSRMPEINRLGGSPSYKNCVEGKDGGVDQYGSSMNTFLGQEVLPDLMVMKKVGVFVDRPKLDGDLLARNLGNKPYVYLYAAEDICSWSYRYSEGRKLYQTILLRDTVFTYDESTGLPTGTECLYRQMWVHQDGYVHVQMWRTDEDPKAEYDIKVGEEQILQLTEIPFAVPQITESLLADAADYQISMMNLASADINYVFKANFPIYVEQYDPAAESIYTRRPRPGAIAAGQSADPTAGTEDEGRAAGYSAENRVGATDGRRYPKGTNEPNFIAPPAEPLLASLKKQETMRDEIFMLIDIAASNAQSTHASAESKQMDNQGVETGLSYIGMELEWLENQIARFWGMYEAAEPAQIKYPEKYKLKTDAERIEEAKALGEVKTSVPSRIFGKEVSKRISRVMLRDSVSLDTIEKIESEVDAADYVTSDPNVIKIAADLGMVDAETGSNALGFEGKKVVPIAKKEHTERLAEIAASQATGAQRGVRDQGPIAGSGEQKRGDKRKRQPDPSKPPKTRGPA
jgi:hypothetical protein